MCTYIDVQLTDLEAVQQYEKMLAIEATLINAEHDVKVEHITGVSYKRCTYLKINVYTYNLFLLQLMS